MIGFPFEPINSTRDRIALGEGLSFLGQFNDPFARADRERKVPEEVEPQKTVYPTFCRNVMAQNFRRLTFCPIAVADRTVMRGVYSMPLPVTTRWRVSRGLAGS